MRDGTPDKSGPSRNRRARRSPLGTAFPGRCEAHLRLVLRPPTCVYSPTGSTSGGSDAIPSQIPPPALPASPSSAVTRAPSVVMEIATPKDGGAPEHRHRRRSASSVLSGSSLAAQSVAGVSPDSPRIRHQPEKPLRRTHDGDAHEGWIEHRGGLGRQRRRLCDVFRDQRAAGRAPRMRRAGPRAKAARRRGIRPTRSFIW